MQRFVSRMLDLFKAAILIITHDVLPVHLYTPYDSIGVETNQQKRKKLINVKQK